MYRELSNEEKLALTGILKWVVSADNNDSLEGIIEFFQDNNWGDFNEIYAEMDSKFETVEDLKLYLQKITNKKTQEIILTIAKDIMLSDAIITNEEKEILIFLEKIWN